MKTKLYMPLTKANLILHKLQFKRVTLLRSFIQKIDIFVGSPLQASND